MACKNKEKQKEYYKKYYQNNKNKWELTPKQKEKKKKYLKKWRKTHRGEIKEYRETHKEKRREKNQEYNKKWAKENPDRVKNYDKKYSKTEKGKLNNKKGCAKRRALMKNAINTLTKKELKIIMNRDKVCVYCEVVNKNLEVEHIICLGKGGENSFLNIVMACKSCNNSKGTKDVFKWCKEKNRSVPKIVLSLLKKQKSKIKND